MSRRLIIVPRWAGNAHSDVGRIIVLLADDDPFTRDHASNAALWRERLGAEVVLVPGARHFNVSEASAVLATLRSL